MIMITISQRLLGCYKKRPKTPKDIYKKSTEMDLYTSGNRNNKNTL